MKKWILLNCFIALFFADNLHAAQSYLIHDGLFLGLGTNYNSLNINQDSWGKGVGNITTSTGSNSNGVAEGTGAPFNNTTQLFAPSMQLGYLRHYQDTPYLFGFKFTYQHLDAVTTNPNLYIPQVGTMTSSTGATSPLFGWVNVDAVQISTSHELKFLGFMGQSFGNKYFYFGAGPALFNIKSRNYYSIGYAEFDGATVNVTGLVSYSAPSMWLLGAAAELGMTYFISPSWFFDLSYNYGVSGSRTVNHQQTYSYVSTLGSTTYTSTGTLYTKNTLRVINQSVMLTINKVFDI